MMNPVRPPLGGQPPMGGMPPAGGPAPAPVGNNPGRESMLNPVDMVKKTQMGEIRPDMTIREFFANQGLDVDQNTVADMGRFLAGQVKNRTMEGKLGAGGTPGEPQTPQPKPGLQGLMGRLGA